ncbi:cytochrome c oxidase assembly protein [Aquibacillus sp. 3ASR75-11]|uniref:Cytochrome c oxidase assembly protein n=1 Tax=Terrihalobacillus insolitus TaxID=2950438 RepID=A0A9X4AMT5_9BACI|nr:cytochrome c oxidase assembly protein [Terrihalobacillus insolitus]MDC3412703.1 cytochrome c oxidase assembly protein [Terrihalobacillus insolitus]MDC3423820.1 cytochrome c oxidase assembly protein [Terrihalobacillus insolitus]
MFSQLLVYYSFNDFWHPEWILITVAVAGIYLLIVGPFRHHFPNSYPFRMYRKILFLSGLLIGYITLGSPLELLSSYLFSVHMLQMSLLYFVMPPLILFGTPGWLLRPLLNIRFIKAIVTKFNRPWIIVVVFNMVVSFYHFPVIFDYFAAANPLYDSIVHFVMLVGAFCMWWNIICPLPEMERFSDLLKIAYILLNVILLYPVCVVIMFSSSVMYETYVNVPQLFSFLPTLEDQRAGGVVMNVIQEFTLAIVLLPIVYRWVQKQKAKDHSTDPLQPTPDVQSLKKDHWQE